MSDFVVRIDTAKLSAKEAAQIASAIQGTVLGELGKLDLAPVSAAVAGGAAGALILHPEWRGIWIRNLNDLQNPVMPVLQVVEKAQH